VLGSVFVAENLTVKRERKNKGHFCARVWLMFTLGLPCVFNLSGAAILVCAAGLLFVNNHGLWLSPVYLAVI
jgi:hypothetical protein